MPEVMPTREDWGDLGVDPEVEYGYKVFGGKTRAEARPLFVEHPLERAAELRFAPAAVFNYYIFCFVDHLLSPHSRGESDMASAFLRLVLDRAASQPTQLQSVWAELSLAVGAVADRQAFYEANAAIYGSFAELATHIQSAQASAGSRGA